MGDSAAGPDGVPLAAYKQLKGVALPLICSQFQLMLDPSFSPGSYNHCRLVLIPKDDSQCIDRTRPISINNIDNRIIARGVVISMLPVFDALVSVRQKMFVHGRHMTEHVLELNETYHNALEHNLQRFALFLDTRKAFDSIHHDFMFRVLEHQRMPAWFLVFIKNTLKNVLAIPDIAKSAIPVNRGVKQGCPLSPLLFVLCYEPLLQALERSDVPAKVFAAADDLAIADVATLDQLASLIEIIQEFADISGLGINTDKTMVLPSLPVSDEMLALFHANCLWNDVRFTDKYKYLGVLIGDKISTYDIFSPVIDKMKRRCKSFAHVFNSIGIEYRVMIFNIYILPLLSYLYQFFLLPELHVIAEIHKLVRAYVIPWGPMGGGFKSFHLFQHKHHLGLAQPLRDPWAVNLQALTKGYDYTRHVYDPESQWDEGIGGSRISQHRSRAADYVLRATDFFEEERRKCLNNSQTLYNLLITHGYAHDRKKYNPYKLDRLTHIFPDKETGNIVPNLYKNIASVALPAYFHRHQLLAFMHALNTTARGRFAFEEQTQPCYLCGENKDHIMHMYNAHACPFTKSMLTFYKNNYFYLQLACYLSNEDRTTFLHEHECNAHSQPTSAFLFCFNFALWKVRELARRGLPREGLKPKLLALVEQWKPHWEKGASTQKEKNRARLKEKALKTIAEAEKKASVVVYTDGSAFGNPGPAGAGAWIKFKDGKEVSLFQALGEANNNQAELWGLGMALQYFRALDYKEPVAIVTDSALVQGVLTKGHSGKSNLLHFRLLRKKARLARHEWEAYWVPGHADILGNEKADQLAKQGSERSQAGSRQVYYSAPTREHVYTYRFA